MKCVTKIFGTIENLVEKFCVILFMPFFAIFFVIAVPSVIFIDFVGGLLRVPNRVPLLVHMKIVMGGDDEFPRISEQEFLNKNF